MTIVELLVGLLVFGLVFWIVNAIPGIPGIVKQVITIVLAVFVIIWFLQQVGLIGSINTPILK